MGEGRKKGTGGGGNPLNYKVVGNPQPANPKENTIWLNTDAKITGYSFAAEQPEEMAEGEAWIGTGNNSYVTFDALKKNSLMVYPYFAKQMSGGILKDVPVKMFHDGAWVDLWDGTLYDKGNEYVDITGGWSVCLIPPNPNNTSPTLEKREESIYISTWFRQSNAFSPNKPVDLTRYNAVSINVINFSGEAGYAYYLIVTPTHGSTMHEDRVAEVAIASKGERTLDISKLSGEYYIAIATGFEVNTTVTIEFDNVRFIA